MIKLNDLLHLTDEQASKAKVKFNRDNLYNDKEPEKFHQCNPYTIENIKHYIEINNIETKLLSTNYINNTHKMLWKCKCGNDFRKNWNSFYHGSHYCQSCGRIEQGIQRRKDFNYVINIVEENGYKIYEELDINKPISSQKISLIDKEEDSLRFDYLGNNYQKKVEHYGVKIAYEAEGVLMI